MRTRKMDGGRSAARAFLSSWSGVWCIPRQQNVMNINLIAFTQRTCSWKLSGIHGQLKRVVMTTG